MSGGNAQTLADSPGLGLGGTWGPDGTIVFSAANTSPLVRVAATAGRPVDATRLAQGQTSHRFPHFLPDGRHFLFFSTGTLDVQGVYLGSLDSTEVRRLAESDEAAQFVPPDWVLLVREQALYAQRVDIRALTLIGDPLPAVVRVAEEGTVFASVAVSASVSGPFAYRAPTENARELTWVQRNGQQVGTVGTFSGFVGSALPRLSPDGGLLTRRLPVEDDSDR